MKFQFLMEFYENHFRYLHYSIIFEVLNRRVLEILSSYLRDSIRRHYIIWYENKSSFLHDWDIFGIQTWKCMEILLCRHSWMWVHIKKFAKPRQDPCMTTWCVGSCTEVVCNVCYVTCVFELGSTAEWGELHWFCLHNWNMFTTPIRTVWKVIHVTRIPKQYLEKLIWLILTPVVVPAWQDEFSGHIAVWIAGWIAFGATGMLPLQHFSR